MKAKSSEKKYIASPKKMSVCAPKSEKVRLAIVCSPEERNRIKMLASYEDMTLNDFVLDCVRQRMKCKKSHIPNEETEEALNASDRGEGHRKHASIEEMFKFLGM
jgi:hypothetical protein